MDFITVVCIAIWILGAYKGWSTVSTWRWKWINKKELVSYVVKAAVCILLGLFFVVIQLWNIASRLISIMF